MNKKLLVLEALEFSILRIENMKIVTWNCNGAFRKKFHLFGEINADLYVIQECEDPAQSKGNYVDWAHNYLWVGNNKNKGLGVFSQSKTPIERLDWKADNLQLFLPCKISKDLNLLAVWTKQANSPNFRYIGQLWKYLQLHKDKIANYPTIVCGDFNSNKCWDEWDRWWNHSDVVRELEEIGILSLYHAIKNEGQGEETEPTLFMHRKPERPYHIDYAFVSQALYNGKTKLEVGNPDVWLEASDHMPIIFEL
ncbi:MAG: exonuclease III [Parvibaculaceae bacterium]|jgi:exonuclease III